MKKIYIPMMRYGDKEFDEGFIGWGFNSYEDQMRDARGVLSIVRRRHMKILDIACGLGIYHKAWLDDGHTVVGTDLSETFIFMAGNANESYKNASYRVEDYETLSDENEYDLVTMIDTAVEEAELCNRVFAALKPRGQFVFQVSNPHYQHARGPLFVNNRTWRENSDRTFLLTRNEYNPEIDRWEYEEWLVDVEKEEIVVQHNFSRNLSYDRITDMLMTAGFSTVSFMDHEGRPYLSERDEEPRNYFCVAYKGEAPGDQPAADTPMLYDDNGPMQTFDDNGPVQLFDDNGPIG